MKEYIIGIALNYGMNVTANSEEEAKEAVYAYLSHPVDNSTEAERKEEQFDIDNIRCHERQICLCERA